MGERKEIFSFGKYSIEDGSSDVPKLKHSRSLWMTVQRNKVAQ